MRFVPFLSGNVGKINEDSVFKFLLSPVGGLRR